jgi:carbamoyl-phosphate synthase large subunit
MTDTNMADRVYIEPLTLEFVTRVIRQEKPDGLLPTLGGQVGLNLALQLAESGVLAGEGVKLLGTSVEAIKRAEDREMFKDMMNTIGEPIPESIIVSTLEEAEAFAAEIGLPLIVAPPIRWEAPAAVSPTPWKSSAPPAPGASSTALSTRR